MDLMGGFDVDEACTLVVFGATGDLAGRKLFPALYSLFEENLLPKKFNIVGIGRSAKDEKEFCSRIIKSIEKNGHKKIEGSITKKFEKILHYVRMDIKDDKGYSQLCTLTKKLGYNTMFYLATSSNFFKPIIEGLDKHGMAKNKKGYSRVLFEKPFGHDLQSARALNKQITSVFPEDAVFRIDHYLGKDSVQNILVLRFANTLFEPLWNHQFIDNVQITVSESIGIENRADYYDQAGAFRDILQNHMLHLMMLAAMEPPTDLSAAAIHDEKVKVLRSIKPMTLSDIKKHVVRAQYSGAKIKGKKVKGYHEEKDIPKTSRTETFVALKMHVDNWRWRGTPFYLRTGKRMERREADIRIQFRSVPEVLFNMKKHLTNNCITIKLQPEAGVSISFNTKSPGKQLAINPVDMDFCQDCMFGANTPEAYEQLLLAAMRDDHTLFARWDEVEKSWELAEPILHAWKNNKAVPLHTYPAGSMGPTAADNLLESEGRRWLLR